MNYASFHIRSGFTLIELSIVLVIIGLIVGGVLVGQELIAASAVRSTISQLERYSTATNAFRDKYSALPGDIPEPYAARFGFKPRGTAPGQGDGNGSIEGIYDATKGCGYKQATGETAIFWSDLSTARMIEGAFTTASSTVIPGTLAGSALDLYFPKTKVGDSNYLYVWSGITAWGDCSGGTTAGNINFFGLSSVSDVGNSCSGCMTSVPGLSVKTAYAIDTKIDDGFPMLGRIIAGYLDANSPHWAGATGTGATAGSAATCYDNSATASGTPGVGGAKQHYSLEMNSGSGVNCALSFQFQ